MTMQKTHTGAGNLVRPCGANNQDGRGCPYSKDSDSTHYYLDEKDTKEIANLTTALQNGGNFGSGLIPEDAFRLERLREKGERQYAIEFEGKVSEHSEFYNDLVESGKIPAGVTVQDLEHFANRLSGYPDPHAPDESKNQRIINTQADLELLDELPGGKFGEIYDHSNPEHRNRDWVMEINDPNLREQVESAVRILNRRVGSTVQDSAEYHKKLDEINAEKKEIAATMDDIEKEINEHKNSSPGFFNRKIHNQKLQELEDKKQHTMNIAALSDIKHASITKENFEEKIAIETYQESIAILSGKMRHKLSNQFKEERENLWKSASNSSSPGNSAVPESFIQNAGDARFIAKEVAKNEKEHLAKLEGLPSDQVFVPELKPAVRRKMPR